VVSTTFTVTADGLPWARRPAQVCIAEAATTFRCRTTTTTAAGRVAVKRTVTAPYRLKLVVRATRTSDAVTSETYSYGVQAVARMQKKDRTLTATLHGAAGQQVKLQRLDAGTWRTVVTYRAASRYTVRKPMTGAEYRIVVPDTALMTGAVSNSLVM
jgi:hypothetical protein